MLSTRNLILGTLAVGGIAAAGYYGFRYYREERSSLFGVEQDRYQKTEETAVKNIGLASVLEKELPQKHVAWRCSKKSKRRMKNLARPARTENLRQKAKTDENEERERKARGKPVTEAVSDDDDEDITVPSPRIVHLQHVRNVEELEMTFEALADYYFNPERSDAEIEEAKRELDWAWPIVHDYKSRVVSQNSSSAMETEELSSNGADSLDSSPVSSMVATEDDANEEEVEEWRFMTSAEVEVDAGYENGDEESSSVSSLETGTRVYENSEENSSLKSMVAEDDRGNKNEVDEWRFMSRTKVAEDNDFECEVEESSSEPLIEVGVLINLDDCNDST